MELYVVQVTHRVGPETSGTEPILVTDNAAVALTAAFGVDAAGYRLFADGDGAKIFRLQPRKMELADGDGFSEPKTLVFARIRDQHAKGGWDGWFVNWYDKNLEKTYGRVFAPLTA